jgi:5'-nucleotidase
MKATDNIALFDMDGSLADYEGAMIRDLNKLRSPDEPETTAENLWDKEKLRHISARMNLIKSQPNWWSLLAPLACGMSVLGWCKANGFDIHILTKGPKKHSNAWSEKLQWCQEHLGPDVDVHVTSDKGLVYGKILYDDYPAYMLRWLEHRPRGLGIMPGTPGNKSFSHPNVIRIETAADIAKIIPIINLVRHRKAGEPLRLS